MTRRSEQIRALAVGEVDVWYTPTTELTQAAIEAQRSLLSREELVRCSRFLTEPLRRDFAIAHAQVRAALSVYVDVPLRDWEFGRTEMGRPFVTSPRGHLLEFSSSHTTGLVSCAVALARDVGVDAEWLGRSPGDMEAIAGRRFAPAEAANVASQAAPERHRRILDFWTLKEAYAKARGLGLSLPFDRFAFQLDGGEVTVAFSPEIEDDADRWCFSRFAPTPVHLIAVAATRQDGAVRFRVRPMVPHQ